MVGRVSGSGRASPSGLPVLPFSLRCALRGFTKLKPDPLLQHIRAYQSIPIERNAFQRSDAQNVAMRLQASPSNASEVA